MLETISVKNLALIEQMNVEFEPGLNIITGPTGSGKTLLIDALKLCLGERADYDLLPGDGSEARITAFFQGDSPAGVLESYGTDGEYQFRRVLKPSHKSPAYLNDERIRLKTLQQGRSRLIDFHGQHENQAVFRSEYPREVLDRFGSYGTLLASYRETFQEYDRIRSDLDSLRDPDGDHQQRLELLNYQLRELDEFDPDEGEWDQIEERRRQLEAAEDIDRVLRESVQILEQEDSPADQLDRIGKKLSSLPSPGEELEEWFQELEEMTHRLEELRQQLREQRQTMSHSEHEFDELMDRRGRWMELSRKHNVSPENLYSHFRSLADERNQLQNRDQRRDELEEQLGEVEAKLEERAEALREERVEAASRLEQEVESRLEQLNLEESRFRIECSPAEPGPEGADHIEWLFSSHSSQEPGPFTRRISGGEISRVLLAIKSALADADTTPVLVFDEIDTGISGEEADSVGQVLQELSEYHQVICITHLPLVASHADHHIQIERTDRPGGVDIAARSLDRESRITEMSRLLSGDEQSDVSREQARELLKR